LVPPFCATLAVNRGECPSVETADEILRTLIASVVLAFNLLGAANADEMRIGLISVTLPVIAILHDELFVGEAVGHIDRTGTIGLRSTLDPDKKCVGSFRYTGSKTGLADMRCDDG